MIYSKFINKSSSSKLFLIGHFLHNHPSVFRDQGQRTWAVQDKKMTNLAKGDDLYDSDTNASETINIKGTENSNASSFVPVKLGMWDFGQCDPKKCSGRRLARHNLLSTFNISYNFKGIVLSPIGK